MVHFWTPVLVQPPYRTTLWHMVGMEHSRPALCASSMLLQPRTRWIFNHGHHRYLARGAHCVACVSMAQHNLPDAHSHPQDDLSNLQHLLHMRSTAVAVMGVRQEDWEAVLLLKQHAPRKVIPCFGVHPWYAHQHSSEGLHPPGTTQTGCLSPMGSSEASSIASQPWVQHSHFLAAYAHILDVPPTQDLNALEAALRRSIMPADPAIHSSTQHTHLPGTTSSQCGPSGTAQQAEQVPSSSWPSRLEDLLRRHPQAVVGECGLDRAAVIPGTKVQVRLSHQVQLVRHHLQLAALLQRPISMHCVRATGPMQDLLVELAAADQLPPRIMMHSFGGPPESVRQMLCLRGGAGARLWFSFSTVINAAHGGRQKLVQRVKAVPDDRLLIESDQNSPVRIDSGLDAMLEVVAEAKGWTLSQAAEILVKNFEQFYEGFLPEGYSKGAM